MLHCYEPNFKIHIFHANPNSAPPAAPFVALLNLLTDREQWLRWYTIIISQNDVSVHQFILREWC